MTEIPLTYDELVARLDDAEQVVHTLVAEQADAIVSERGVHLLRLHETDQALRAAKSLLEKMLAQRTQELADANRQLLREVSERKRAERRLASIIEYAMDGVITVDDYARILIFNAAAEKMFGRSASDVIGKPLHQLFPERYRHDHGHLIPGFPELGESAARSVVLLVGMRSDNVEFPIEATISNVDAAGERMHTIILRDVSRRKQTEDALIRSEKLASVGRVAAMIAHEINNPLSAIHNVLFLLGTETITPTGREYLKVAETEVQRAAQIAQNTLGLSRQSVLPQKFSLCEALDGVLVLLAHRLNAKNITLKKRCPDDLEIVAVAGEVRQVLWNMLTNALDAVNSRGHIEVRVSKCGRLNGRGDYGARITVADDGGGIPRDTLHHILEPFFTTKDSGTGLGLWVSSEIIKKHAGSLKVRSSTHPSRHGTIFSVHIPSGPLASEAA